jgi:ribonuclease R
MTSHDSSVPAAALMAMLEQRAPRPLTIQDLARLLSLEHYDRKAIRLVLEAHVAEGTLRRIGKTRYQWIREADRAPRTAGQAELPARRMVSGRRAPRTSSGRRIEGRYARVRAGYGFVEVLGREAAGFPRDILIPAGLEGEALHGDRVIVEILRRDPRLRRSSGRIISVVERVHEMIIGTLERQRQRWWLVPENDLLPAVEVIGGVAVRPQDSGLIALARLTRPPHAGRAPGAELERVLGEADTAEVQFLTIAYEHGLRIEYPPEARREAESLPVDPLAGDLAGREDLRHLPFVTIDGESARDFDDAVCLEEVAGGVRLHVAIADVSHYVRPATALDLEARRRGTSVYFPNRAIAMFPERLSNELCSLNPGRDRLVLVAELTYDNGGRRRAARFHRGVIRSQARLTYTRVAAVLSRTETAEINAWRQELAPLLPQLHRMHALMQRLYRQRVAAGSLDLDLPEALIDLSDEGRSIGVRLLARNDAHRLIEEFMLEANRAVAEFLTAREIPLPYRIHEAPHPDSIDELNQFLGPFGVHVSYEGRPRPQDIQRLLDQLQGHRLARVLSRQVLRSLTQAQYSTRNSGHFGLAFALYCHFTSPIRRYPDLLVHRQLARVLDGNLEGARAEAEGLEADSIHSSQAEREAMQAEWAMLDLKKAEFMLGHLLEPEPGTIVSVTSFGFYVELDAYPIEGLVRIDDLTDDRYRFIEAERALCGWRTGYRFRLGDQVVVEATNVSLRRRTIDLALLERLGTPAAKPRKRGRVAPPPRKDEAPRNRGRNTRPRKQRREG